MTAFSVPPSASPSVTAISCCTVGEHLHMLCGCCLGASVEHFQPKVAQDIFCIVITVSIFCQPASRNALTTLTLCCYYCIYFLSASRNALTMLRLLCHYYCIYFCQPVAMHSCHILPNMGVHSHRHSPHSHWAGTNCSHLWHLYVFMLIHTS